MIFSGENETHFYKLVQQNKVDWKILKLGSLTLSRFDVYYLENINDSDESSVKYFLQDCVKNLEEKRWVSITNWELSKFEASSNLSKKKWVRI